MCHDSKYLSPQVGMDVGLFHPCFFAFGVIFSFIFNIFKYYLVTWLVLASGVARLSVTVGPRWGIFVSTPPMQIVST